MILCALVGSSTTYPALAQSDHVVLVHGGVGEPIAGHLVDELVSLGITVAVVKSDETDLAIIGRSHAANAALRVISSKHAVEVWLDGTPQASIVEESKEDENNPASLALRVVENLRGHLVIQKKNTTAAKNPMPVPETQPPIGKYNVLSATPLGKPVALREPRIPSPVPMTTRMNFTLRIGPAIAWQAGGQGISEAGMAFVGIRYAFSQRFGADLMGLVPVISSRLSSPAGVVLLSAPVVLAGVSADLLDPASALRITPGLGLGVGGLSYFAQPGNRDVSAHDGSALFLVPAAHLGLTWRFRPSLGIFLHTLMTVATPRPVIHLQGRPTNAYFGQPQIALESGLWMAL